MADYYFWADTDNDWECAGGDNWRDAPGGAGNPYSGGAQQPGDGDKIYIQKDCVAGGDHSAITFAYLNIDNGIELGVLNGGDIRFDTDTCDFNGDLTVDAGGNIRFTDITELETNGTVTLDGGTIEIVETDASLITWEVRGTGIAGTANGGTIKLIAATQSQVRVYFNGGMLTGNAASRIIVDGDSGANQGFLLLSASLAITNVDFDGLSTITLPSAGIPNSFDNCLFRNMGTVFVLDEQYLIVTNSWIYDNTNGISVLDISYVECRDVVFGENEAAGAAENTGFDVEINSLFGTFHNCKFSSTTPFSGAGSEGLGFSSTSHDQDETDWRQYQGRQHFAQPEFGAGAQGGSGTAVKCVTSANAADTDTSRFRRLVGFVPATHGDVLAVTLYIKGTNTKVARLTIDPDSIYGTTQSYAETADGNWNQRTIPNYTVAASGGAGTKVCVPIYLDFYGASETWYYDTLDWTVS